MAKRKVESQIGNLTPDHLKFRIDPISLHAGGVRHTIRKFLMRVITFLETSSQLKVCTQSYGPQSWLHFGNFRTPIWESRDKNVIWMWALWKGIKYTIRGKVVASPKFGP
jgi:hypothetical protein